MIYLLVFKWILSVPGPVTRSRGHAPDPKLVRSSHIDVSADINVTWANQCLDTSTDKEIKKLKKFYSYLQNGRVF